MHVFQPSSLHKKQEWKSILQNGEQKVSIVSVSHKKNKFWTDKTGLHLDSFRSAHQMQKQPYSLYIIDHNENKTERGTDNDLSHVSVSNNLLELG